LSEKRRGLRPRKIRSYEEVLHRWKMGTKMEEGLFRLGYTKKKYVGLESMDKGGDKLL